MAILLASLAAVWLRMAETALRLNRSRAAISASPIPSAQNSRMVRSRKLSEFGGESESRLGDMGAPETRLGVLSTPYASR